MSYKLPVSRLCSLQGGGDGLTSFFTFFYRLVEGLPSADRSVHLPVYLLVEGLSCTVPWYVEKRAKGYPFKGASTCGVDPLDILIYLGGL